MSCRNDRTRTREEWFGAGAGPREPQSASIALVGDQDYGLAIDDASRFTGNGTMSRPGETGGRRPVHDRTGSPPSQGVAIAGGAPDRCRKSVKGLHLRRREFIAACCYAICAGSARSSSLIEPHMQFTPTEGAPQVAITLDACMGETDMRILGPLVENRIPVTIFATKRWLDRNPAAITLLRQNPDLFAVENHGAQHLSAVIGTARPYGLVPAGTAKAITEEVHSGGEAITRVFGIAPKWYRDATALYSPDAMELIGSMGYRIAGFSLNGDFGASASARMAHKRIAGAKSGDVVISHINQPHRPAGAGVIAGILALKSRGFRFMHLDDVAMMAVS